MKVYKVTLLIVDTDDVGGDSPDDIVGEIENVRYPNRCLAPKVMDIQAAEIGEWRSDNPLNHSATQKAEFERLFSENRPETTEQSTPAPGCSCTESALRAEKAQKEKRLFASGHLGIDDTGNVVCTVDSFGFRGAFAGECAMCRQAYVDGANAKSAGADD